MSSWFKLNLLVSGMILVLAVGCGTDPEDGAGLDELQAGKADQLKTHAGELEPLNSDAGDLVIYELQVRSANACVAKTGGTACESVLGPDFEYFGTGCDELSSLRKIKKSTLDDLLRTTSKPHRSKGITLQYIKDVVGANAVWLMPIFPHNYQYDLPHHCDDLGSPYAVRDYLHVRGSLANRCVKKGADEWSDQPCWGNAELEKMVKQAHDRGMKVMLDLAFNHFGHEYYYYDYVGVKPIREWVADGANMWDFAKTYDKSLVWPEILDSKSELPSDADDVVKELCGTYSGSQEDIRRYLMWNVAFDHERELMSCDAPASLENQVPGFYLGKKQNAPSTGLGDNYSNDWRDVKFLYHNESNVYHSWEFMRSREYAFRVINYYLSIGVDAFRLDHANGLTENEWRYIFRKAEYYQAKRKLPEPIFLSESFHNIEDLNRVFDVLTEGYQHDICNGKRDTSYIESKLFDGRGEFLKDYSYILLDLENHDEGRLLEASTGFDIWRGVTFYALAAASRGSLALLGGQEWGEPWDLGFRRSDYLRGRFPEEANWNPRGDELTELYGQINKARNAKENEALRKGKTWFLRTDKGTKKSQLFAMARYMEDCSNTMFTFFRLWVDDVEATYGVTEELAGKICLKKKSNYKLVNVFTGENVWEDFYPDGVRSGSDIIDYGIYVHLTLAESFQWLRLEKQ